MCNLSDLGIDDLECMALQSLQLRLCCGSFGFSQHLWRSQDAWRLPIDGPLYGNQLTLRGSMSQRSGHIVRVACLIKADMPHYVARVLKSASTNRRCIMIV